MKTTMRDKVCQLIGKYQFLEEDEAATVPADPRKTAPAGKWCADSAAQAAESAAKEAQSNG